MFWKQPRVCRLHVLTLESPGGVDHWGLLLCFQTWLLALCITWDAFKDLDEFPNFCTL